MRKISSRVLAGPAPVHGSGSWEPTCSGIPSTPSRHDQHPFSLERNGSVLADADGSFAAAYGVQFVIPKGAHSIDFIRRHDASQACSWISSISSEADHSADTPEFSSMLHPADCDDRHK